MKILSMTINWNYKYGNSPDLKILVDKLPVDFVYQKKNGLYYAETEGYVRFFYYRGPGNGYGGRTFHLTMEGGNVEHLKGPWASNPSAMNTAGFGPCMEVRITDDLEAYVEGPWIVAAMTVAVATEGMAEHLPDYAIVQAKNGYVPVLKGVKIPCKRCKGSGKCDTAEHWSDPMKVSRCPECGGRGE